MTGLPPPPSLSTKGQWLFLNHYLNEMPLSETLGTNTDWICPSLDRPLLLTVLAKKIAERDLHHAEAVHTRLASQYGIKVPTYEPVLASPANVAFGMEGFASIDLRSPMIPQHVSLPTVSRRRLNGRQFRSLSADVDREEEKALVLKLLAEDRGKGCSERRHGVGLSDPLTFTRICLG